jgi:hypothetical protein
MNYINELSTFYTRQTIRPSWLFRVTFPEFMGMEKLNNHMVVSVKLPEINTTEEKYIKSSKLFPDIFNVYDMSSGIRFDITFVENLTNDVEKARWNYYKSLITHTKQEGGIFYAPPLSSSRFVDGGEGIKVDIIDDNGTVSMRFMFNKCIISAISGNTFSYEDSSKITPQFSFVAQEVTVFFNE